MEKREAVSKQLDRFSSRGRLIVVNGENWRWRCGKWGTVVAYSECGKKIIGEAWEIKGLDCPDTFARGKRKITSDGMVMPSEIAKWITTN